MCYTYFMPFMACTSTLKAILSLRYYSKGILCLFMPILCYFIALHTTLKAFYAYLCLFYAYFRLFLALDTTLKAFYACFML